MTVLETHIYWAAESITWINTSLCDQLGAWLMIGDQETQTGALYQPRGVGWGGRPEGSSKGRGYMCTYGWFMLGFDRKQQNSVKWLLFNKK